MLLAIDSDEDFVNEKGVTVNSMLTFQSPSVKGTEFDTPEADRFAANSDASLGKQVLDIAMAQVEAIVEPDRTGNDIGRKSVTFICVHGSILAISVSLFVGTSFWAHRHVYSVNA